MEGSAGLEERSKAPGSHPNAIPSDDAGKVIATKLCHQKWGPKKVIAVRLTSILASGTGGL